MDEFLRATAPFRNDVHSQIALVLWEYLTHVRGIRAVKTARAALIAFAGAAVLGAACRTASPRASLREVTLPDLARLDQSVQTQIRGRFAALERTRASAEVSDGQLGAAYGEYAMLLQAAEYFDSAEPAYLNAQALMPADPRWPYHLSHVHRQRGETERQIAQLTRVLELQPANVAALIWLGRAYQAQGDLDRAEPQFQRALDAAPRTVAALVGLGQVALARKDFARAVKLLDEALEVDPNTSSVHAQLATAHRALGNTRQAEAHLAQWRNTEVLVPDPMRQELDLALESGLSYELRGVRSLTDRDFRAAEEFFRKGVSLAPGTTPLGRSLRHKLGTALALQGDVTGAVAQFEEVASLAPRGELDESSAKAFYSLGLILAENGRLDEAVDRFTRAVAYNPNYVEARLVLADLLRGRGRVEASLPHYAAIVRLNPRAVEARIGYAMALVRLQRWTAARDWLGESVQSQPDRPELSHALARLLAAAPDPGVRDGRRALALTQALFKDQKTTELGETMAMTMAELGQFDEAASIQRGVLAAARAAGLDGDVRRMTANLRLYEQRHACRDPWPSDHPAHRPGLQGVTR